MLRSGKENIEFLNQIGKFFSRNRAQLGNTGACFSGCLMFPARIRNRRFKRVENRGGQTFGKAVLSDLKNKKKSGEVNEELKKKLIL